MGVDQMEANKQLYHSYRWNPFMDLGLSQIVLRVLPFLSEIQSAGCQKN